MRCSQSFKMMLAKNPECIVTLKWFAYPKSGGGQRSSLPRVYVPMSLAHDKDPDQGWMTLPQIEASIEHFFECIFDVPMVIVGYPRPGGKGFLQVDKRSFVQVTKFQLPPNGGALVVPWCVDGWIWGIGGVRSCCYCPQDPTKNWTSTAWRCLSAVQACLRVSLAVVQCPWWGLTFTMPLRMSTSCMRARQGMHIFWVRWWLMQNPCKLTRMMSDTTIFPGKTNGLIETHVCLNWPLLTLSPLQHVQEKGDQKAYTHEFKLEPGKNITDVTVKSVAWDEQCKVVVCWWVSL